MRNAIFCVVFSVLSAGSAFAEEELGRLFFTPAQRSALDSGKRIVVKRSSDDPAPPPSQVVPDVALEGVVVRSDGERTIWVNGQAFHNDSPDGIRVRTDPARPASTTILIRESKKSTRLLVGQQLDVESGTVRKRVSRESAVEHVLSPEAKVPGGRPPGSKTVRRDDEPMSEVDHPGVPSPGSK